MSTEQPTNQPTTNQPTVVSDYLSVRLKVPHSKLDVIKTKLVHDVPGYCIYMHSTTSEHFHVCLPGLGKSDTTRIGKRIRDNFGVSGNGGFSIKSFSNGLSSFVFYSGHEGTAAVYEDSSWDEIVSSTKTYYVKEGGQLMLPLAKGKAKDADADWQLTYSNFVSKAVNHARRSGLTGSLKEVLCDMIARTKWRPSYHMVTHGVPDHYYKDFEFRSGKRHKPDMGWMDLKM